MYKYNFKPIAFVALAAILLSGCAGLKKMKKNADQIQFKVTPELLEAHAGEVNVAIDTRFPAKYFDKKATEVRRRRNRIRSGYRTGRKCFCQQQGHWI